MEAGGGILSAHALAVYDLWSPERNALLVFAKRALHAVTVGMSTCVAKQFFLGKLQMSVVLCPVPALKRSE